LAQNALNGMNLKLVTSTQLLRAFEMGLISPEKDPLTCEITHVFFDA
jgi:hypothetical protein